MEDYVRRMHLRAGREYGRSSTCGEKIDYVHEDRALSAAQVMSERYGRALEAYPCAWCFGWHIGRAMAPAEIERFSREEDQVIANDPDIRNDMFALVANAVEVYANPGCVLLDLVGYAEMTALLGVTRQGVRYLAQNDPDFPVEVAHPASGPLFTWKSVIRYAEKRENRKKEGK